MVTEIGHKWKKEKVICAGDGMVVGVSGGADSVCLLCLLAELQKEWNLRLYAIHIHHGIRGEEADRDAAFTKELCQKRNVPCEIVYKDIPALAQKQKCSEEEMGRIVRYQVLEEYRKRLEYRWIAVAHHREDNAETVLWNLCRGSGLAGLTGIHAVRGHILRPLLFFSRAEIEAWLSEKGQEFCTDRTNLEGDYTRNRIRHQVLPVLEREVNAQAVRHIAETAERLTRLQTYIEKQVAGVLHQVRIEGNCFFWEKADYEHCPKELRAEAVLELLKRVSGQWKDILAEHVGAVMGLYEKEVGKRISLPYRVVAERTYTGVCVKQNNKGEQREHRDKKQIKKGEIEKKQIDKRQVETGQVDKEQIKKERVKTEQAEKQKEYYLELEKPGKKGELFLSELQSTLFFELWDCTEGGKRVITSVDKEKIHFSDGKIIKFPESSCTKWFDYDRIKDRIAVRTRRPGDSLVVYPDGRRKKLKDYWIDQKLPKEEREKTWLLTAASEVLWIFGDRTGEGSRIGEDTRQILIVWLTKAAETAE